MPRLAKKYSDEFDELKKCIEDSHDYFKSNYERFEEFNKIIYDTAITNEDRASLSKMGKPDLEFNILESIVSRKLGNMYDHESSISVNLSPGTEVTEEKIEVAKFLEDHFRFIMAKSDEENFSQSVLKNTYSGGFSAVVIGTEYTNPESFEQVITMKRAKHPTLCGWDPVAYESHKGDGNYCFQIVPMGEEDFIDLVGEDDAEKIRTSTFSDYMWHYQNGTENIYLVADFFKKTKKKETIVQLSTGEVMLKKEYEQREEEWAVQEKRGTIIEQIPQIIKERKTIIEGVDRFILCGSKIIEREKTDYRYLPIVFVDGNSETIRYGNNYKQMTRPAVYQAKGIQRLKNFAGQSLASELENTIAHKMMAPLQGIPDNKAYQKAYTNIQQAEVLVYNEFYNNDPNVRVSPPSMIARPPIPPEITNTFRMSDEMTQAILSSHDASNALQNAPMSGVAFAKSAMLSDKSSVPYMLGYINAMNRCAKITLHLIPKYYTAPRNITTLKSTGDRENNQVNTSEHPFISYDPNEFDITVEAGVNFSMQKEMALQTITALSSSNKGFAEFFDQKGLQALVDNIDIRGSDEIKLKAKEYMAELEKDKKAQGQLQEKQTQMQMQQAEKELQSPTPAQIEIEKIRSNERIKLAELENKNKIEMLKASTNEQEADTNMIKVMADVNNMSETNQIQRGRIAAENLRTAEQNELKLSAHINEVIQSEGFQNDGIQEEVTDQVPNEEKN